METAAFAAFCFVVAVVGSLAGLVLGNLRLPVVLLLSSSPAAGGATNIAISGAAAATASVEHIRAGRVNWRLVAWMAPPSVAGAVAGGFLAGVIPGDLLLGAIAAVLLYSGVDLLRWERNGGAGSEAPAAAEKRPGTRETWSTATGHRLHIGAAVLSGALIGVLGGLVGLILGALRLPALLRLVGESPARAVGTNMTVGVCVGAAGVVGHLPSSPPDLDLIVAGSVASVPGALLGARMVGRLSERQLVRAIGAVLIVAAAAAGVLAVT
jgi:uncharacterized protein